MQCSVTLILANVYPYVKNMENNLVFVKPMNILTANSREKEVFIDALHT
jgi:hypothetical protein